MSDVQKDTACHLAYIIENYVKDTFQVPCCCYESELAMDLLLFKTINVSMD